MDELKKDHLYRLKSRNLICGVYNGASLFIGIREKFGDLYFDVEQINTTPGGTATPIEDLGPIPDGMTDPVANATANSPLFQWLLPIDERLWQEESKKWNNHMAEIQTSEGYK